MSLDRAMAIGNAGLSAQRTRMETIASNLANARTTRTPEGGPFRRLAPVFTAQPVGGSSEDGLGSVLRSVGVERIDESTAPPVRIFEPGHPDADAEGYVAYPDINPVKEMVDMLSATRSYEANVTVIQSVREMKRAALDIIS